jgi:hypothetical protein
MATNMISDQRHLIVDENDDPPTYQDVINQGKQICLSFIESKNNNLGSNTYGTFISPTNDYTFNSQQPTVIIVGGCPTCKVRVLLTHDFD